jgi:hypothetical protein
LNANGYVFDDWDIFYKRWLMALILLMYLLCNIGLIAVVSQSSSDGLFDNPVLSLFLIFISIIFLVVMNTIFPMALYRVSVEYRYINGLYGKEIVCIDLDRLLLDISQTIETMGYTMSQESTIDDIYPSFVPKFLKNVSRVNMITSTDIRIVVLGPHDGKAWIFVGPITSNHPDLLIEIVDTIDKVS